MSKPTLIDTRPLHHLDERQELDFFKFFEGERLTLPLVELRWDGVIWSDFKNNHLQKLNCNERVKIFISSPNLAPILPEDWILNLQKQSVYLLGSQSEQTWKKYGIQAEWVGTGTGIHEQMKGLLDLWENSEPHIKYKVIHLCSALTKAQDLKLPLPHTWINIYCYTPIMPQASIDLIHQNEFSWDFWNTLFYTSGSAVINAISHFPSSWWTNKKHIALGKSAQEIFIKNNIPYLQIQDLK